jgi:hypothetical protein
MELIVKELIVYFVVACTWLNFDTVEGPLCNYVYRENLLFIDCK